MTRSWAVPASCPLTGIAVAAFLTALAATLGVSEDPAGYSRQLTVIAKGVIVTETSTDPRLVGAIRAHAREVSGFVRDGMPAMMRSMMGGG